MHDEAPQENTAEKFVVRLPRGMRKIIAEVARRNRRSMNSELVAIIENALTEGTSDFDRDERSITSLLTSTEAEFMRRFRRMSEHHKRAWLDLLS